MKDNPKLRGLLFDFGKLDMVALVEDGIEITHRDLLNEELSHMSPLVRAYVQFLEQEGMSGK